MGVRHVGSAGGKSVVIDSSGSVYVAGGLYNSATFGSNPTITSLGMNNIFVAKSTAITGIGEEGKFTNNHLLIYANPTAGTCNVTIPEEFQREKNLILQVFDNTGKLLQQTRVEMQQKKIKINLEEEAKGIYNVILSNGIKNYSGKIVFE